MKVKKEQELLDIIAKNPNKVELLKEDDFSLELIFKILDSNLKSYLSLPKYIKDDSELMNKINIKAISINPFIYKEFSFNDRTQEISELALKGNAETSP